MVCLPTCLSVYLSVCLSIRLSVCLYLWLKTKQIWNKVDCQLSEQILNQLFLYFCVPVCLCVCLSVCCSVCLSREKGINRFCLLCDHLIVCFHFWTNLEPVVSVCLCVFLHSLCVCLSVCRSVCLSRVKGINRFCLLCDHLIVCFHFNSSTVSCHQRTYRAILVFKLEKMVSCFWM